MPERNDLVDKPGPSPRVDAERLWETLMTSAKIGLGRAEGLCRLTLSDADRQMRDLFVDWSEQAGCTVTVDRMGNIFARRAGVEDSLPPVVVGSHLDTQVAGGRFDGILGVLSGLEIVRTLNDLDLTTKRPIEIVNWTNEEGARFQPPMLSSGVFAGIHELDWALARPDDDGYFFGQELQRIGYAGEAPVGSRALDSYFELHIEQDDELEKRGLALGIVSHGFKAIAMNIDVHGETAHSGPTPMAKRRNALVGAAMLIVSANEIGWSRAPEGKSTANRIHCWPNKPGILPDYAWVTLDFRHPDADVTRAMVDELEKRMNRMSEKAQVTMEVAEVWEFGDVSFDPECIGLIQRVAEQLNVPYMEMLSQAGHDAYHLASVAPSALLFSPCRDGITHNEAEDIDLETTRPAVDVLLNTVIQRANR